MTTVSCSHASVGRSDRPWSLQYLRGTNLSKLSCAGGSQLTSAPYRLLLPPRARPHLEKELFFGAKTCDGPDGGIRGGGPPVVLLESVVLGVLPFSVPPIVVTLLGAISCSSFWGPCFKDALEKRSRVPGAVCRRTPVSAISAPESSQSSDTLFLSQLIHLKPLIPSQKALFS